MAIAFVCIKIFLKLNPSIDSKKRSIIWLLPLFVPVIILIMFQPQPLISSYSSLPHSISLPNQTFTSLPDQTFTSRIFLPEILSITGLLCLSSAIIASGFFAITVTLGGTIAAKAFHVMEMGPDEYVSLQKNVKEISQKIGISSPKVGLIEDQRPNAFIMGFGRRATIVFSLGLLNLLNDDELAAVASHELAHVKAKDYLFRSLCYSLNVLSFFNPLSYFTSSEAQKERELLADQRGASLLGQPKLMANVLIKLERVLKYYPQERFAAKISGSLFIVSPLARRAEILGTHPQIAHRVRNISTLTSKTPQKPRHVLTTLFLLGILICTAALSGYALVQIQQPFNQKPDVVFFAQNPMAGNQSTNSDYFFQTGSQLPPNADNFYASGTLPSPSQEHNSSTASFWLQW